MGAWEGIFRRGFHRKVDRREVHLLVCLSTRMEVIRKSRWKKLLVAEYSDGGYGLSELITR